MAYRRRPRTQVPPLTAEQRAALRDCAQTEHEQELALQERVDMLIALDDEALIVALDDEEDCVIRAVSERLGRPELLR